MFILILLYTENTQSEGTGEFLLTITTELHIASIILPVNENYLSVLNSK